jgi:hypothetical protein
MKTVGAHARSVGVQSWPSARRASGSPRAGDVITVRGGGTRVLSKDWTELTTQDLAGLGIGPADQPTFFIPAVIKIPKKT